MHYHLGLAVGHIYAHNQSPNNKHTAQASDVIASSAELEGNSQPGVSDHAPVGGTFSDAEDMELLLENHDDNWDDSDSGDVDEDDPEADFLSSDEMFAVEI